MFVLSGSMVVVIELSAHSPCHVRLVSFWPGVRLWFLCCLPVKWYSRASYDPFHPDPREVVGGFGSDACDVLAVHSNGLRSHTCLVFPWMRCMRRTWADQFVPLSPFDLSVPLNDTLPWCRSCLTIRGGNTGTWNKVVDGCYLVDPASSHMLVSKIKPCMFKKLVVGPWVGSIGPPLVCTGRLVPSAGDALLALTGRVVPPALRTTAKAFAKDVFINQERKLGARRRSDTVLVSTINDADQGSADVAFRTPLAPYEKSKSLGSGGSMVARLKLKGIDGRAPPGVEPAA
ncbi:hypothetical protein Lal_00045206 [Lupinus albus]|nr:hypothetical protein Lal_00045206 [Lupinus albus]